MLFRLLDDDTGNELEERIIHALSPKMLLNKDTGSYPSPWPDIYSIFTTLQAWMHVYQRHWTLFTTANNLLDDGDEEQHAINRTCSTANGSILDWPASVPRLWSIPAQQWRGEHWYNHPQSGAEENAMNSSAVRLEDRDQKFLRDLSQCCEDYCDEYGQISLGYNFTDVQLLCFLDHLITRDAQRFYLDAVKHAVSR